MNKVKLLEDLLMFHQRHPRIAIEHKGKTIVYRSLNAIAFDLPNSFPWKGYSTQDRVELYKRLKASPESHEVLPSGAVVYLEQSTKARYVARLVPVPDFYVFGDVSLDAVNLDALSDRALDNLRRGFIQMSNVKS